MEQIDSLFKDNKVLCPDGTYDIANGIVAPCMKKMDYVIDHTAPPPCPNPLNPNCTHVDNPDKTGESVDSAIYSSKVFLIVAGVGLIGLGIYLLKTKK